MYVGETLTQNKRVKYIDRKMSERWVFIWTLKVYSVIKKPGTHNTTD